MAELLGSIEPVDFYVNDDAADGGVAAGNDANDGLTTQTPMRHIQALLDKYPNSARRLATLRVAPGIYAEHITLDADNIGLTIVGAGRDLAVIDGSGTGVCLVASSWEEGTIAGLTFRNGSGVNGGGVSRCEVVMPSHTTWSSTTRTS